jgi:hypothetical protein
MTTASSCCHLAPPGLASVDQKQTGWHCLAGKPSEDDDELNRVPYRKNVFCRNERTHKTSCTGGCLMAVGLCISQQLRRCVLSRLKASQQDYSRARDLSCGPLLAVISRNGLLPGLDHVLCEGRLTLKPGAYICRCFADKGCMPTSRCTGVTYTAQVCASPV